MKKIWEAYASHIFIANIFLFSAPSVRGLSAEQADWGS